MHPSPLSKPYSRGITFGLVLLVLVSGPSAAQERWTLTEDLRIGTLDEGPDSFNDIRGLVVAPDGSMLVLDFRTQDIRIFDGNGRHVRTVGRSGAGPGEMRNANGMLLASDGTVWVNDPSNARFSVFATDGGFLRQHTVPIQGYGYVWGGVADPDGLVLSPVTTQRPDGSYGRVIERIGLDGQVRDTIAMPSCTGRTQTPRGVFSGRGARGGGAMMSIPFSPTAQIAFDQRGAVWCTPADEYRIIRTRLQSGDTLRVIEANIAGPPVTAAERASEIARIRTALERFSEVDADYSLIPRTKPPIRALDVDDANRLWARRTPANAGEAVIDVWTEDGRHLATARGPLRLHPYQRVIVRGHWLYGVVTDEDDVQYVVRARIGR